MNLSYCRVCNGHKYVIHLTSVSLPIHIWPLESAEDHLLEDAGRSLLSRFTALGGKSTDHIRENS
jgi:hypothetical protein